jgi:flagellar biosynthesis chaperone FliJ
VKKIDLLIKLNNNALDDLKKILAELFKMQEELSSYLANLKNTLEKEKKLIDSNSDLSFIFHNYLQVNLQQQEQTAVAITVNEEKIAQVQQEIYNIFIDIKKYEFLLEQKTLKQIKKENKIESNRMDEFAMTKNRVEQ